MQERFEIDTTPKELAYEGYRNYTYSLWFALGEFIDNAITSAYQNWDLLKFINGENYALEIQINLDASNALITVSDNAAGITKEEFARVLVAGERPPSPDLLSVYGKGMKLASFWWGRSLRIESWPVNKGYLATALMDLDLMQKNQNAHASIDVKSHSTLRHGTRITLSRPYPNRFPDNKTLKSLNLLLRSMYRTYTNSQEKPVKIFLNGELMTFKQFPLLVAPYWPSSNGPKPGSIEKEWRRDNFVFTTSSGKRLEGWYGILGAVKRDLSGFFLHYKGKGMDGIGYADSDLLDGDESLASVRDSKQYYRPPAIFGQEGSYRFGRFTGEFDISDFGKTQSTDSVKWSAEEENEFIQALLEDIKSGDEPFWKMADKFQPKKAAQLALRVSDEIDFEQQEVRTISQVLFTGWQGLDLFHSSLDEADDEAKLQISSQNFSKIDADISERVSISDGHGHTHEITLEVVTDRELELFTFDTSDDENYVLRLNSGHALLRRFQWSNKQVREAALGLTLLMALPEIFLPPLTTRSSFKVKMNQLATKLAEGGIE